MVGSNQRGHNDRNGSGTTNCGAGKKYRVVLPEDFQEFLRLTSPVGEGMDAEMVTWWGFGRVKNIPDEYPHPLDSIISDDGKKYLFFADYCIWCWAWAISCADDGSRGKVALIAGHTHDRLVANSFSDFVQKYLSDPRSVM
jgi:hypothetical protein